MPEVEIRFRSESEYRRLRTIRDRHGIQWRGMLIQGAKRLEGGSLPVPALDESREPNRGPRRPEEAGREEPSGLDELDLFGDDGSLRTIDRSEHPEQSPTSVDGVKR